MLGGRLARFRPHSNKIWLPASAAEWIASANIAPEPVITAATLLAMAIAVLAASA